MFSYKSHKPTYDHLSCSVCKKTLLHEYCDIVLCDTVLILKNSVLIFN